VKKRYLKHLQRLHQQQSGGTNSDNGEEAIARLRADGRQRADFSAHQLLKENQIQADEELVKPLFAYILYQLLSHHSRQWPGWHLSGVFTLHHQSSQVC
jgi:hypothetical protein